MEEKLIAQVFPGWQILRPIIRDSRTTTYEIFRQGLGGAEKAMLSVTAAADEQTAAKILNVYKKIEGMSGVPGIVRCMQTEYVQLGNTWYICARQELLSPLKERMDAIQVEDQIRTMAGDLAAALEACHARSILHLDIRPEQVYLTAGGKFKLANPGVRWAAEGGRSSGSPSDECLFQAPESRSGACTPCSDTYSLGLLLYWTLNDKRGPFLETGALEAERARANSRRLEGELVPPPRNGSEDLKDLVLRACAFSPDRRYGSAAEMHKALDTLGQPMKQEEEHCVPPPIVTPEQVRTPADDPRPVSPERQPRQERQPRPERPPKPAPARGDRTDRKGKKGLLWLIPGAAVLAVLLLVLPRITRGGTDVPLPFASDAVTTTEAAESLGWSQWAEQLPAQVTTDAYLVQEQPLYRTRVLEHTSSTTDTTLNGWTFLETVDERGEFQDWSSWSLAKPEENPDREIETEIRSRTKTKETKTSSSDTMTGWTKYDTTKKKGDYGSWSDWSSDKISATEDRDVDTKTQYRYREKEYTTSKKSSLDGWTKYDSESSYTAWGDWSEWSDKKVNASDTVEVKTETKEVPGETEYAYSAYFSSDSPKVDSSYGQPCGICAAEAYGGTWKKKTKVVSSPMRSGSMQYYCSHVGSVNKRYSSGGVTYYSEQIRATASTTKTMYSYRTRSKDITYHYYKWGAWSSWSDSKPSSADREIQDRTLYRSRTCTTEYTHHFYRWTDWSDWKVGEVKATDSRKVESQTYYRYRDRQIIPTHYFSRWTDWSDFGTAYAAPSETQQVDAKLQLRWQLRSQEEEQTEWTFTDVPQSDANYEAVKWVVDRGITKGTSETTFTPGGTFTRRQMAIMFWRAMGYPEPQNMQVSLSDVTASDPYRKAIIWTLENGLTGLESEGKFGPDRICTRGQFITALYRAAGSPAVTLAQEPFEDVEKGMIFYDAVLWAYANNISSGVNTTQFGVDDDCLRLQACAMLYRALAEPDQDVPETTAPAE